MSGSGTGIQSRIRGTIKKGLGIQSKKVEGVIQVVVELGGIRDDTSSCVGMGDSERGKGVRDLGNREGTEER